MDAFLGLMKTLYATSRTCGAKRPNNVVFIWEPRRDPGLLKAKPTVLLLMRNGFALRFMVKKKSSPNAMSFASRSTPAFPTPYATLNL